MLTFCYSQCSLSLSLYLSLPLSTVQLFTTLPYSFFACFRKWQNANMPFSSVFCLRSYGCLEITTNTQAYCSHTPTVDRHSHYWCAMHGGARKGKVRLINIHLSLKRQRHQPNPAVLTNNKNARKKELQQMHQSESIREG